MAPSWDVEELPPVWSAAKLPEWAAEPVSIPLLQLLFLFPQWEVLRSNAPWWNPQYRQSRPVVLLMSQRDYERLFWESLRSLVDPVTLQSASRCEYPSQLKERSCRQLWLY